MENIDNLIQGSLGQLMDRDFSFHTRPRVNPVVGLVQVTPTLIALNNPNRVGLYIVNHDVGAITIHYDNTVTLTRGISLAPNGGGINFKWYEEFDLVGHEVWAISTNPNAPIYLLELDAISKLE